MSTDPTEKTSITAPPAHLAEWSEETLHENYAVLAESKDRDRDDIATARRNVQLELQRRSNGR